MQMCIFFSCDPVPTSRQCSATQYILTINKTFGLPIDLNCYILLCVCVCVCVCVVCVCVVLLINAVFLHGFFVVL